jgi:hypothetical protein
MPDYVEELLKSPYPIKYAQVFRAEFEEDPELLLSALKSAYKLQKYEVFEALAIVLFDSVADYVVDQFMDKPDLHYFFRVDPRQLLQRATENDPRDIGLLLLACKQANANNDPEPCLEALNRLSEFIPEDRFVAECRPHMQAIPFQGLISSRPKTIRTPLLARELGKRLRELPDWWVDEAFARGQREFLTSGIAPPKTKLVGILRKAMVTDNFGFINYLYELHKYDVRRAMLCLPRDVRDYILENCDATFDGPFTIDRVLQAQHLGVPLAGDTSVHDLYRIFQEAHKAGAQWSVHPLWFHHNYNVVRNELIEFLRGNSYPDARLSAVLMVPKRYRRGIARFLRTGAGAWWRAQEAANVFEANLKTDCYPPGHKKHVQPTRGMV